MKPISDKEKVLAVAKDYLDAKILGESERLSVPKLIASAGSDSFNILRKTVDFLSTDDLSLTLRAIWPDSTGLEPSASGECTKEEAVTWFSACNPQKLMTPIDLMLLPKMPNVITVYRGEDGLEDTDPADAVSWTLDPIMAMENPDDSRFGASYNGSGYQASIKKEDVLAFYFRHDMEIILNPDKLFDIETIAPMGELLADFSAYDVAYDMKDWYSRYYNQEIFRRLKEKLEPLGRINELIEATMDFDKYDTLVKEFNVASDLIS